MLDVCLLGTGGMMPLPYRWLTALLTRYNGSSLLIDCGEGTQVAMKKAGFSSQGISEEEYNYVKGYIEKCLKIFGIFSKMRFWE